ncbi:MAG TPA: hypothetical protein VKQ72_21740, partial [Aggregatilineales bacterium]|nr:hypothetical protein [Aggregatilineales bacterium]
YLVAGSLHLSAADGMPPRRPITDPALNITDFRWSPDGKAIAFYGQRGDDSNYTLYVTNKDGSQVRTIASNIATTGSLAWANDSAQLVFTGNCGNAKSDDDLCVATANGTDVHPLAHGFQPSWSPDNRSIHFTFNNELHTIDATGGRERRLTHPTALAVDSDSVWSPDSTRLVFQRIYLADAAQDGRYSVYSTLNLINADGSGLNPLSDGVTTF